MCYITFSLKKVPESICFIFMKRIMFENLNDTLI